MNNLFVIHTQYNLILAVGLSTTVFKDETNDIIIFQDFKIEEKLIVKLKHIFNKVVILPGNWPKKEQNIKEKYNKIRKDCSILNKSFANNFYSRAFVVDDMCIQEMYIMKLVHKANCNIKMAWLEDGANAYFDNGVVSKGMGATHLTRFIRKVVFSSLFGLWKYYHLGNCMGSHKMLKDIYVTFPKNVRNELVEKKIVEIDSFSFEAGMIALFKEKEYFFEEDSIIIAMDKLDVYGDSIDYVNSLIKKEIEEAHKKGKKVYYKYHPREDSVLPSLVSEIELNRLTALESYMTNSNTKNLTILGIKSTSLQTSKKMGFSTVSLIKHVEPNNASIVEFYNSIGVVCK